MGNWPGEKETKGEEGQEGSISEERVPHSA